MKKITEEIEARPGRRKRKGTAEGAAEGGAAGGEEGAGEEKSIFHGKKGADYQGRSWIEPPNEKKKENDATFLPKRWIHTWSGHTKARTPSRSPLHHHQQHQPTTQPLPLHTTPERPLRAPPSLLLLCFPLPSTAGCQRDRVLPETRPPAAQRGPGREGQDLGRSRLRQVHADLHGPLQGCPRHPLQQRRPPLPELRIRQVRRRGACLLGVGLEEGALVQQPPFVP